MTGRLTGRKSGWRKRTDMANRNIPAATVTIAAPETFPEIPGMSSSGRLCPFRNPSDVGFSVSGNGRYLAESARLADAYISHY